MLWEPRTTLTLLVLDLKYDKIKKKKEDCSSPED